MLQRPSAPCRTKLTKLSTDNDDSEEEDHDGDYSEEKEDQK